MTRGAEGLSLTRDLAALGAFIASHASMPFAPGRHANDCVAFVFGAIAAQFGWDPLPGVTWTTELGGARVIRRLGGLDHAFSARLTPIAPARAHRGDVAGVLQDGELAVMIVEGLTLVGPGNVRAPRSAMVKAWSAQPPA